MLRTGDSHLDPGLLPGYPLCGLSGEPPDTEVSSLISLTHLDSTVTALGDAVHDFVVVVVRIDYEHAEVGLGFNSPPDRGDELST